MLLDFADRQFKWDTRIKQYRVTEGAGKGSFISREAILRLTLDSIENNKGNLVGLADELANQRITLKEFQLEAAKQVRLIHTQQAAIAAGGFDRVTPEMWLSVARELQRQYRTGRNIETGQRYGLKWLCEDIKNGKVSLPQLKQRLALYANSGKASFWEIDTQVQFNKGLTHGIRKLGATHRHCVPCLLYASYGPQPLTSIIRPTQQCDCGPNCVCTIFAMSIEDAIAMSGGVGILA
jgi:hypothetical protein